MLSVLLVHAHTGETLLETGLFVPCSHCHELPPHTLVASPAEGAANRRWAAAVVVAASTGAASLWIMWRCRGNRQ